MPKDNRGESVFSILIPTWNNLPFLKMCVESIRKNCGQMQFLLKWGITNSAFRHRFTHKGRDFSAELTDSFPSGKAMRWQRARARLKALWWIMAKDFGPLHKFWDTWLS